MSSVGLSFVRHGAKGVSNPQLLAPNFQNLIATADPTRLLRPGRVHGTRIGILSDQRKSKKLPSDQMRKQEITPGTKAKKRPIATHANSEFALTHSKQRISQFLIATKSVFPFRFLFVRRKSRASGHATTIIARRGEPVSPWTRDLCPCLSPSVPLPYYGAIRRGVAVIPESHIGRQLHGD
jgi:hypothetical protein